MFRRRSSSRHQPLNTTPSASAQTAASRAFIASRESNAALSSAAAAAALRSHTTTPTSVENVQSKRMLQRQLSNSSRGSSVIGNRRGSLHRTPSSGSMSSRTFRENSPGRPQTSSGETVKAPPVPPMPQGYSDGTGVESRRRPASVQPSRGASPSTIGRNGRVTSLDRALNVAASPASPRGHRRQDSLELDRPTSRTSINFSYPMNARPNSPPRSPVQQEFTRTSNERPPSRPLSPEEVANIQYSVNKTSSLKVKKRPQRTAPGSTEGSHLAHKTMGSRPTGTLVEAVPKSDEPEILSPSTKDSAFDDITGRSSPIIDDRPQSPIIVSEDGIQTQNVDSVRPKRKKRPSTVMEDHEAEERASPVVETVNDRQNQRSPKPLAIETLQTAEQTASNSPLRLSPSTSSNPSSPSSDRLSADHNADKQQLGRQSSNSPNRSARFSNHLTVSSDSPIHEPPPRSMSPAKPALKISSSPDRRLHTALRTGQTPSEISDATSVASDDGSRAGSRKKAVKVSFDDGPEIVGVAASPPTSPEPIDTPPSPTEKTKPRNWFSISKRKPGFKTVVSDDEFESVLKPRPALPSFGSIRGTRETDESTTQIVDDNASISSSDDNNDDQRGISASSDHAIGGILVNASRQDKSVGGLPPQSKATNESLTLEVTSPETKDSVSRGIGEDRSLDDAAVRPLPTVVEESDSNPSVNSAVATPARISPTTPDRQVTDANVDGASEAVPTIAIQPATPGDENRSSLEIQNMPGGFPISASERSLSRKDQQIRVNSVTQANSSTPADVALEADEDSDKDSGESIYSDAAEAPGEFEGDGFGSIDAIVDSPLPAKTESPIQAPESPSPVRVLPVAATTVTGPPLSAPEFTTSDASRQPPKQRDQAVPADVSNAVDTFDSTDPSWPLKTKDQLPHQAPAQTKPKAATPIDPHEGSHLRKALGKGEGQRLNPQNRLSSLVKAPVSASKRIAPPISPQNQSRAVPKKQTMPQSMTFPGGLNSTKGDESDSDSSFKRTRSSSRFDGQYTMKRTMRASRPVSMLTVDGLAERSTSPRASSMRMTMRGPPVERSSGIGSLRSKMTRARPKSFATTSNSKSRFDDSDDEGAGGRKIFRSRFADDSDDEPLPNNLTPVRGIPRRRCEFDGESTDLEDSSDDEYKRTVRNGKVKPIPQMSSADIDAILSQPRKRGLLARLKPKGKDGKVRKSGLESAARRDTPLERSRLELAQMREDAFGRPTSPKLHKKPVTGPVQQGLTWPIATTNTTQSRPSTSDGIVNGASRTQISGGSPLRPQYHRHGTHNSIDSEATQTASDVVVGRTGRKKRFPLLRKAFGLRD